METINNYLENMFAALPRTSQMLKLKEELLATMEDKYNELKNEGKSENEAIGIVISEFGNIDELMREVGIEIDQEQDGVPVVGVLEAEDYLNYKKKIGLHVGLGVFLCATGVALLILLGSLFGKAGSILGLITMIAFIAAAVGLFIYSGMKSENYKYLKSDFTLPSDLRASLQQRWQTFKPSFAFALIAGVCMCILSPVMLFAANLLNEEGTVYGLPGMLLMIGAAAFLFVYAGNIKESFSVLLQLEDSSKEYKENNKVIVVTAAFIWPLASLVFLIGGFVFKAWHICWIVFPITGLLFGAFSAAYSATKGNTGNSK
jgi:hypothetical protein